MKSKSTSSRLGRHALITLRLTAGAGPVMGPGKAMLLEHIEATGSISAAAREMGMSYRRAWQLAEAMNRDFDTPLIVTATGGSKGGGARVTAAGRDALARFRRMETKASNAIAREAAAFAVRLKKPAPRR